MIRRIRSWFALEWIGDDDLYSQAVSEITPTIFLGRRPTVDTVSDLSGRGVTHVASCLEEKKRDEVEFLGRSFDHFFLPADDAMHQTMTSTFEEFFAWVDAARSDDPSARFLVHCEVGVSRSASLVVALLMRDDGLSFLEGYELVRSKRIQALPNLAFASQLQHLEHELQPERAPAAPSSLAVYVKRHCKAPAEVDQLQAALEEAGFDAPRALRALYGGEIPRVVQGAR